MAGIRAFVAVELNDDARAFLRHLQPELERLAPPDTVRWTRPESVHLTLQFLGDVAPGQVEAIAVALQGASQDTRAFEMELAGLGVFPNPKRPRIVWLGIQEPSGGLAGLQRRVGEALAPLGFEREKRSFRPHLTIGRASKRATGHDLAKVGQAMTKEDFPWQVRIPVDHIVLMKSDLQAGGPVYSPLSIILLSDD